MKKILALFALFTIFSSCDDGDLTFDSFDFSNSTTQRCTSPDIATNATLNSVYRVNGNEALIITFPTDVFPFINQAGNRVLQLGANVKVIYRVYSDVIPNNFFCSTLPSTSPNVVDEWIASEGTINITTQEIPNTTTRATATFTHAIMFRDITFNSGNGEIIYTQLNFDSNYRTQSNVRFAFSTPPVQNCSNSRLFKQVDSNPQNLLFLENINETLVLNFPENLYPTTAGISDPIYISEASGISIVYSIYGVDVSPSAICDGSTAEPYEAWRAAEGNGEEGIIEIESTAIEGGGLRHQFTFRNVRYIKNSSSFVEPFLSFGEFTPL